MTDSAVIDTQKGHELANSTRLILEEWVGMSRNKQNMMELEEVRGIVKSEGLNQIAMIEQIQPG